MRLTRALPSVLAAIIAALFFASLAQAESIVWNKSVPQELRSYFSGLRYPYPIRERSGRGYVTTTVPGLARHGGWISLFGTYVTIQYNVRVTNIETGTVLAPDAQVPKGQKLKFEFIPHVYTDISWFTSSGSYDSPYGDWVGGAAPPPIACNGKDFVGDASDGVGPQNRYVALSVNPPAKSLTMPSGMTCEAADANGTRTCSFDQAGAYTPTFDFSDTYGNFYLRMTSPRFMTGCAGNNSSMYSLPVAAQTIPFPLAVVPSNETPSTPTVVAPGAACVVEQLFAIGMTATDPDGDTIRYGIDWNADGSIDEYAPPTGYVPSGTAHTATRTYATAGEKTVKVLAQDEGGAASDWATLAFSCTNPPPPPPGQCEDNLDNDGDSLIDALDPRCSSTAGMSEFEPAPLTSVDLSLRVLPSLIRYGNTTRVHWSATGLQSCAVTAANGDNWTSFESPVGGQASSPITGETTYTLSCLDTGGATLTRTATVRTVPVWTER